MTHDFEILPVREVSADFASGCVSVLGAAGSD
jgi:hypothetical protein